VKLLDFGIARAAAFAENDTGLAAIKLSYLAPEQVEMRPFDHRIDVFALGAIMHEMLTGLRLFPAKNDVGRMKSMLAEPIPSPAAVNAAVPRELDRIVMRALAIDPVERYPSAAAMAGDLERTLIAARYSSRELGKLLGGLFLPPQEPRVVVEGQAPPAPAPEPVLATGHPASPTDRMRRVEPAPPPDALGGAVVEERTRLVRAQWRGRLKIAAGAAVVGTALAGLGFAARLYVPALLTFGPPVAAGAPAPPPPEAKPASAKRQPR